MTNKQPKKAKVHPELNDFDVSVTEFGEIEGSLNIDKINQCYIISFMNVS